MPARKYIPLIAIAALAISALVAATLTFTNLTYWQINATLPPAMKYAGADTGITGRADGSGYSQYVYVSYYYANGYNITRISIVGFTGDPTNYTNVLQICNRYYNGPLNVQLVAKGAVSNTGYESYIKDFRVYFYSPQPSSGTNYVEFQGTSVVQSSTGIVQLAQGQCAQIGAYVLVDPNLPSTVRNGKTVIAEYEVDVVFSTP